MNTLMLKTHHSSPSTAINVDGFSKIWVSFYDIANSFIDFTSIALAFCNTGPAHFILVHIIPGHFVNACLKNTLEM
jgi:hypothetical protein